MNSANDSEKHQEDEDFDYSQSLKNFDLTDYTKVLKDLIIWIYLSKDSLNCLFF